VLHGPQSGLYGSDAIGGVISITTKTGSGPPQFRGSIEGGSFDTFNQSAGVSGSVARFSYDSDIAHFHPGNTDMTPFGLVAHGPLLLFDGVIDQTIGIGFTGKWRNFLDQNALAPGEVLVLGAGHELTGSTTIRRFPRT